MIDNVGQGESEFTLFGRLTRAFSHVARGDLSVITNEVSYLATQLPASELGRARNRCAQMAATISMIAGLQEDLVSCSVDWRRVLDIFGVAYPSDDLIGEVSIDRIKIERLASILRQMLPGEDVAWRAEVRRVAHTDCLALLKNVSQERDQFANYGSWSSFASKELGERAVIDGVVADLITRAHGWVVSIASSRGDVQFQLRIPIKTKPGAASLLS